MSNAEKKQPQIVLVLVKKSRDKEQAGGVPLLEVRLQVLWHRPTSPKWERFFFSFVVLSLFGPSVTRWHVQSVEDKFVLVFINSKARKTKLENILDTFFWNILPPKELFFFMFKCHLRCFNVRTEIQDVQK